MPRHAGGRARNPRSARLPALAGVVAACAIALAVAVASTGSADRGHASGPGHPTHSVRPAARGDGATPASADAAAGSPSSPGPHLSTAVRCGPALSSPDGVEAQTCVVARGEDVRARTYYRNATGEALDAVLSLMGPGGRSVRTHCAVDAGDEPALCETPRERGRGGLARYTAVAEFAEFAELGHRAGGGRLLLRSGSNSPAATSS
ncbi:hypothetical protein AB0D65_20750 [Streptomyces griseoloalbus]|uniref:Serine/threonine protein kinase n=1 Tax=Streptomyces griseoloalbus TaxID=67303 RepID=A0ABV3E8A7_9ACTN